MNVKIKNEFDGRKEYEYLYCDHFIAWVLSFCECCCKNAPCFKRRLERFNFHKECVELLQGEIDIVSIIRTLRMSDFVNNNKLKNYQRFFINKFKKYNLSADEHVKDWVEERLKNELELTQPGFEEY